MQVRKVLCVGDSLTAGWYQAPGASQASFHPYGASLFSSLGNSVEVVSLGWPGWTSVELLEGADQRTAIRDAPEGSAHLPGIRLAVKEHSPSVVLLLAGTNDLFSLGVSGHVVSGCVWKLHALCHAMGVPTVAIGVPSWCWRTYGADNEASRLALNSELGKLCADTEGATFLEFPFPFDESSGSWSEDGVHMSPSGYARFGRLIGDVLQYHPALQT